MTSQGPRLLTRPFLTLTAGQLLQSVGYATMILFPLHLEALGASRAELGTIMATAGGSGLLLRPLIARALDTLGARRVIAAGTVVLALATWLAAAVSGLGPFVYFQRALFGVGVATLFSAYLMAVSGVIPPSIRTRGIAVFGIAGILPLALNPFVDAVARATPGALTAFYPFAALAIAASGLFAWFVRDPPRATSPAPFTWAAVREGLGAPPLRPVWLATIVFALMVSVFMSFATVSAGKARVEAPAMLWLFYAGGAVSVRLFGSSLPDRIGPTRLILPSLAVYGAAMVLVAFASGDVAFSIAGLLAGVGHGYCFPVLMSLVIGRAPAPVRGSAVTAFTAIWGILELGAPPLFGAISDASSDRAMFLVAALIAAAGGVLWRRVEAGAASTGQAP